MIEVVTTYAERYWDLYAKKFIETFTDHWDKSINLITYTDEQLVERSSWLSGFKQRHGLRPTDNYRFDAVRFAHKVAAIDLAYHFDGIEDILVWFDADCVTHSEVSESWLSSLLGDADFAYLNRKDKYPESSFMMFYRGPGCSELVRRLVEEYSSDALFKRKEWHDGFIIGEIVNELPDLKTMSLSGKAYTTGHPFVNGPLGKKMDHLKGKRKILGASPERSAK